MKSLRIYIQFVGIVNGSALDVFAKQNKFDENGIVDELLTSLPSEAKYKAELKKMEDETYIKIIMGEKPVSYFDEFVDKWKKSGGDQLEKEANEWYTDFK